MSEVILVQGDARHIPLADASVHCIITSPPYFGLRDYSTGTWEGGGPACTHSPADTTHRRGLTSSALGGGKATTGHQQEGYGQQCARCGALRHDQQIGSEALHDCLGWATGQLPCTSCYICTMRTVAKELWRVLRDDGVMFINIGDSYNAAGRHGHGTRIGCKQGTNRASAHGLDTHRPTAPGLKPKDLCMIPARLALALQADGWTLRSDIIWSKTNCMPESVRDRPTRSHEQVFLFSKQGRYFWDAMAIQEKGIAEANRGGCHTVQQLVSHPGAKNDSFGERFQPTGTRNSRSVWTISTESTSCEHFATMPTELVRRCILAGTSEYGVCSACQAPYRRIVERLKGDAPPSYNGSSFTHGKTHDARAPLAAVGQQQRTVALRTTGWVPGCTCDAPRTIAVVFDPFVGSGTVAAVACALGRHGVGLDLSYSYLHDIAIPRIAPTVTQPNLFHLPSRPREQAEIPQLSLYTEEETR